MRLQARTLPIRLPPLPGEALDSWLEAVARRMDTTLGDVLLHLGFPVREAPGNQSRGMPTDWTIMLDEQQTMAIAHATGVAPETVAALTLAHYDRRALSINFERQSVNRWTLWGRGSGSRYCPDCLRDSGGRWPLVWRLGWAFACSDHQRMLADCCPDCGRILRSRPRSGRVVPRPSVCGNPPFGEGGVRSGGCGFDLTQTRTPRLAHGHPVLIAQEHLWKIIQSGTASFGVYEVSPQPSAMALSDIRAIGGRVLADLPSREIPNLVPADLADMYLAPDEPTSQLAGRAADRPGFMAPPRGVNAAVAATIALHVLGQDDAHQAGEKLRGLLEAMRDELWQISATVIDNWGRGLSPVLDAVHLAALAPTFRPSDRLRYCTVTAMPRHRRTTDRQIARRARKIPSTFWPAWTARFTPTDVLYPRVLAPALAGSLLLIGSRTNLDSACQLLGSVTDGSALSYVLQKLDDQPRWPDAMAALIRLADYLDAQDTAIDYQRRRQLDYSRLLPHDRWKDICRHTGTLPGSGLRERIIRCYLFQRISGLPPEAVPGYDPTHNEWRFRAESARFAVFQTPELSAALAEEAQTFLTDQRILDEPVVWQPPLALLADLELPGPDPAQIDVAHLHQLVHQRKNPLQHAAHTLGTSFEAVRHVLEEHPAPATPPTKNAARATGRIRFTARQEIPKDTFSRFYLHEHRSLAQISALTGFSSSILAALAREYGIQLRDGPQDYKRCGSVEREWLIEQYVTQRRTLPDLAQEKGMSTSNMARWAHAYKIPLRPRGGGSHDMALRVNDQVGRTPAILHKALTTRYAWQRLEHFLTVAASPTLHEAALSLDLCPSSLAAQITRLEQDLGSPLLERAARGRPMQLTPFGSRVAEAVRELLAEEMPPS
ncbi:TniQ family protein [Streptomyces sp. NPDC059802]|uniref:TniQ family protein n=1 Tax=Streptomyces sp. NPDC059802 TaxID=3346952 RepID=UPI00365C042F